jgi:hypothetical protein
MAQIYYTRRVLIGNTADMDQKQWHAMRPVLETQREESRSGWPFDWLSFLDALVLVPSAVGW